MPERFSIEERAQVSASLPAGDGFSPWRAHVRVEYWFNDADRLAGRPPDEVVERDGNMALNAGLTRLLNLLVGAGGTAYNNANARLGVGDNNPPQIANATQVALQGTNQYYQLMDATYPQVSGTTATFRATFGPSVGNFAWFEWGCDQGTTSSATVAGPMLNRKVEFPALITKSGGSATLTATLTAS